VTARQRAGARSYVARLAELAPQYGFGFVERKVKPQPAVSAAAYLSAYFVKGRRGKATLWESVRSAAMPRSIVHVSVRLTQETGCTMRLLRLARYVWVIWSLTLSGVELRLIDEHGFLTWAEAVTSRPERGPPQGAGSAATAGCTAAGGRTDGRTGRASAPTGRTPVPPLPRARMPRRHDLIA
jgi:hypothetical protein